MKPDFNSLLEIYDNSLEKEKLIFIDVLNDLIKGIFQLKKAKKIPQSIYINDLAKDVTKDMNFQSLKEYHKFMTDVKEFIYKGIDINNRQTGLFNITKERSLLSIEIKKYYYQILKEELEEIQSYRKLILNNFINYGFIEIFVSKNEEYNKICKEFEDSITNINEKNRKIYIGLSNIKDKTTRKYLERIEIDYGVDKINKWFEHMFNDLELLNYLCNKNDLVLLEQRINFKQDSADYDKINGELYYSRKKIHKFRETNKVNKLQELCKIVFNYPIGVSINFKEVNTIYKQEDDYYTGIINNVSKIKRLIDNINTLMKNKTEKKSLLLLSQETIDNNHYIIRNF